MNTDKKVIKNRAGEVVDITDGRQLIALLLEKVPDPVTRSVLFGTRIDKTNTEELINGVANTLGESAGLVSVMYRVINLVFVTALCRWKQLGDNFEEWADDINREYFLNSRFTKLFRSAIGREDITLDLQIFALIELWVSLKKAEDTVRGKFANIYSMNLSVNNIGLTLQDVRDALKNATFKTTDAGKYTFEYCARLCYKLLCSFPFLLAAKITYPTEGDVSDSRDICISYNQDLEEIVTLYPNEFYNGTHFLATSWQMAALAKTTPPRNKNVVKLYLMTETSVFNGKPQYTYRSFDGEREVHIELDTDLSSLENSGSDEISEVRKFLAFNYKNIRELAIVISDAIKDQNLRQKQLYDYCKKHYGKIIPSEVLREDDPKIYWDNIITLMLVEMGPSDFLELILDDKSAVDNSLFDKILKNIGWRCIGSEQEVAIRKSYDNELDLIYKRCSRNKKALAEQTCALRVQKILEAMNFVNDESAEVDAFEESLSFKYENILVCINTLKQYNEKMIDVARCDEDRNELIKIYTNIFKFLQIFYTGMDSYAYKLLEDKSMPVEENEGAEGEKAHKFGKHRPYFEAFTYSAARKKLEIEHQGLTEAFEGFCKLCEEYNSVTGLDANSSDKAKRLKYIITRNYICDIKRLRSFVEIELSNGEKSTIFEMLENFSDKYYTEKNYLEWLDYFIDLFFFLIYNEDYSRHGLYKEKGSLVDKDCDPIYPYLVTYYKENVDRDNLKKCTYRVPVPTGTDEKDLNEQGFIVNLLTEENYVPQPYFCIPLKYGASDNWWINPFLIPRGFVHRMDDLIKSGKVK